jgi:hypothetical protein
MELIPIKPILLGLPQKKANYLFVRPIINSTRATSCNTYYEVIARTTTVIPATESEPEIQNHQDEVMASGNHEITEEQYAAWADDNQFIEKIVLDALGLQCL